MTKKNDSSTKTPRTHYNGIIADYWDLLRGDTSQWSSRPYFLQLIRDSGQPVLDVGCGTGRLLLDYMAEGIDIDGMDYAADMIAVCREKAETAGMKFHLYVQKMEKLKFVASLPNDHRALFFILASD